MVYIEYLILCVFVARQCVMGDVVLNNLASELDMRFAPLASYCHWKMSTSWLIIAGCKATEGTADDNERTPRTINDSRAKSLHSNCCRIWWSVHWCAVSVG